MADSGAAPGGEPAPLETLSRADVGEAVSAGLSSRPVRTLMNALAELGCPVGRSFFHVMRCDAAVGGGFAPEHGVILCYNRLHSRREVLNAMAHELIHAYDHCRFRTSSSSGAQGQQGGGQAGGGQDGQQPGRPAGAEFAAAAAPISSSSSSSTSTSSIRGDDSTSSDASASTSASTSACMHGGPDAGEDRSFAWSQLSGCGGQASSLAANGASSSSSSSSSSSADSGGGAGSRDAGGCFSIEGGLDWTNCRNHACTEIRAANLSGDCSLWQELMRGNLPLLPPQWGAQQAACVARRAALSVALNPGGCGGREGAAAVVGEVMGTCLADTAPFKPGEGVARP
ncbi:hypothetical protein HXX76_015251 [Chlamydomonas incerta]|uniref:Mitochondrial inner membrane protease ATP23 n=1 Tax=Chlamydomonas incerta TaxID=51695 RepID=A0A835SA44_CHLIN|nr:hypothetical protein HXX76_015251 [Chlamydomonas incerta]|eukprot:KAG2423503.1 hypothetical protein HXX76_015251 [Chlamydomonas incerta]